MCVCVCVGVCVCVCVGSDAGLAGQGGGWVCWGVGGASAVESVLCFNRRARLTSCEGGMGVTRNAAERRSKK